MAKNNFPSENVTRYDAKARWDEGILEDIFRPQLSDAIFRGDTIKLEWLPVDGYPTLTVLTNKEGSTYIGQSVWASGTQVTETAVVEGTLYSNEHGHLLVGEERWSSGKSDWFIVQLCNGRSV
jgi:hypothetical protein